MTYWLPMRRWSRCIGCWARRFPGTRTNSAPAAAKLHLVMSVRGTGVHKVKVTGERAKDHRTLQMGPWVEGRLLLFDLGYFRYHSLIALTETADTSLPAWPPTPTPASWPPTVSGAGAPSTSRASGSKRWPADCSERSSMSRSRWRSSVASTPVPDVPFAVVCAWSRFASPRAPSIGSTSPTSTRFARCPVRCSDLRGSLADRIDLQGVEVSLSPR